MICFHKWSKWQIETIEVQKRINLTKAISHKRPGAISYSEDWQWRKCEKCGRTQMEHLR